MKLNLFGKKITFDKDAFHHWKNLTTTRLTYNINELTIDGISDFNRNFLLQYGLPDQIYNLNFCSDLKTVDQVFSIDEEPLNDLLRIGFDGSGDPLAIYLKTNDIWILNHENGFKPSFVNNDLEKMALCVLELTQFQEKLQKRNSESEIATEYRDKDIKTFRKNLEKIDPKIMLKRANKSYWIMILEEFEWYRDEARKYS